MIKVTPLLLTACFLAACVAFGGSVGCKRNVPPAQSQGHAPSVPSLRIYAISTLAGALEPCGCVKDMLGGIDHAAALIEKGKGQAPHSLLLAAGPLWFLNPQLEPSRQTQDLWKAEAIAESLGEMKLTAWAPGVNDFAAGAAQLQQLRARSGAQALGGNLETGGQRLPKTKVIEVGGLKVGLAGVSQLSNVGECRVDDAKAALAQAYQELSHEQTQIKVALIAAERGEALRWVEAQPGFDVVLIGKPMDKGDGNDASIAPVLINDTLVVQAPNHLQSVAIVDLFLTADAHGPEQHGFRDGTGIEKAEQKDSLQRRISDLQRHLAEWAASKDIKPEDLAARKADLQRLRAQLTALSAKSSTPEGNYFRYELLQVRDSLGRAPKVSQRMSAYYKRVNDNNRETLKGRKPPAAEPGKAVYVGEEDCATCHEEAETFWRTTGHAKAYKTLADEFKEFNLDCVNCHVTGYEKPGGSTVTFVDNLKDIQCEECHGPGSKHSDDPDKKGLIRLTPPENLCASCHHSPHVHEDWDVKEAWTHIIGPGHGQKTAGNK